MKFKIKETPELSNGKELEFFLSMENGNIILNVEDISSGKGEWQLIKINSETGMVTLLGSVDEDLGLKLDANQAIVLED